MPDIERSTQSNANESEAEKESFSDKAQEQNAVNDSQTSSELNSNSVEELLEQIKRNREILFSSEISNEKLSERFNNQKDRLNTVKNDIGSLSSAQKGTFPIIRGMAQIQINKIENLAEKQTVLKHKAELQQDKISRLEAKAEKLENSAKMLSALFSGRNMPAPIRAFAERMNSRAEKIRNVKLPKSQINLKFTLDKMEKIDGKIERAKCKADKLQSISAIAKSFTVLDGAERRKMFTEGLDSLHSATQRSLQFKIEKCDSKIAKLSEKYLNQPYNGDLRVKIEKLTEKKDGLSEKLDTINSLDKPFAEQSSKVLEEVADTAQRAINIIENSGDISEKLLDSLTDDLCVSCVDTVNLNADLETAKQKINELKTRKEQTNTLSEAEYEKLDLPNKGTLLAEYEYDFSDHDQCWTESSHLYQINDHFYYDSSDGYNISDDIHQELNADQMKQKLSEYAEKGGNYSITNEGKKLLDSNSAEKNKSAEKKSSVLGRINEIKAEQQKAEKAAPQEQKAKNSDLEM